MQTMSWPKNIPYLTSLLGGILVFLISAIVFSQYGFNGTLSRDEAMYLYSGQQLAQGIPPYVSIFVLKGPVAPLISGLGASVATLFNLDDVLTVRTTFFVLSCLAVVGIYLLGSTLFESLQTGLIAAFVFIGLRGFGQAATSGPEPKTPMVLFEILSLLLTVRKRWFWAGVCGSLAFLTWQPMVIYPLITIFLAIIQSEQCEPTRNAIRAVSGTLMPIIIVSIYLLYKGALDEFVGNFLFFVHHFERNPSSLTDHLLRPIQIVYKGYDAIPMFLGFLMVVMMYVWRTRLHEGSVPRLLSEDRFAALVLSFPVPIIWSVLDFQGLPDLYVLLPYAAMGFGWLLYLALQGLMGIEVIGRNMQTTCFLVLCATLVGSAVAHYRVTAEDGLVKQRQWAQQVETLLGRDSKLVSIGRPEPLVLLHRSNPNRYLVIAGGVHNLIDANTPGGFEGWLEELEECDPAVIAFGPTRPEPVKERLRSWLRTRYQRREVGRWTLFVEK
jgi:hypothetical protein